MKKVLMVALILALFSSTAIAQIVEKSTLIIMGGYQTANSDIGSTAKEARTITGIDLTLELPISEKMEFIGTVAYGVLGGRYQITGYPTENIDGSTIAIGGGIKMEF